MKRPSGVTRVPMSVIAALLLTAALLTCGCTTEARQTRSLMGSAQPKDAPLPVTYDETGSQVLGAYVQDAVSGDTIVATIAGTDASVLAKLAGIDAPEDTKRPEPGTDLARAHLRRLLPSGSPVELEFVEANWMGMQQPPTVWVWLVPDEGDLVQAVEKAEPPLTDRLLNARIVADGYALAAPASPSARFVRDLAETQSRARANRLGIWSYTGFGLHPGTYVANTATGKFHRDTCEAVSGINPVDRHLTSKRQELLDDGLIPCRKCWP